MPKDDANAHNKIQHYVFKKSFEQFPEAIRDEYKIALASKDLDSLNGTYIE